MKYRGFSFERGAKIDDIDDVGKMKVVEVPLTGFKLLFSNVIPSIAPLRGGNEFKKRFA